MTNIQLPRNNKFIEKILFGWFWWRAWYLEYKKSKKAADAMAENEASKVKLAGEIEEKMFREEMALIDNLERSDRYIEYKNLYQTLTKSVPKITYKWDQERIDEDKLKRLKDLSKEFSSDEMQEMIAWILAGEYNKPWSFSLQTMSIVKNLSKRELELFIKFSSLIINDYYILNDFFWSNGNDLRKEKWYEYTDFLYLQELWLFANNNSSISIDNQAVIPRENCNKMYYTLNNWKRKLNIITISNVWKELLSLVEPVFDEKYFERVKKTLDKYWFQDLKKVKGKVIQDTKK